MRMAGLREHFMRTAIPSSGPSPTGEIRFPPSPVNIPEISLSIKATTDSLAWTAEVEPFSWLRTAVFYRPQAFFSLGRLCGLSSDPFRPIESSRWGRGGLWVGVWGGRRAISKKDRSPRDGGPSWKGKGVRAHLFSLFPFSCGPGPVVSSISDRACSIKISPAPSARNVAGPGS